MKQKKQEEQFAQLKREQNFVMQRIELMNYEKELKQKALGRKLQVNYSKIVPLNEKTHNVKNSKVLIVASPEFINYSNKDCYRKFKNFYRAKAAIIISSPDVNFAKKLFQNAITDIPLYCDMSLQFVQELNLAENETVVLVKNAQDVVVYSYIVEEGNPMKDAEEWEIIERMLETKW